MDIDDFITRWRASSGSERANFQQFAIEMTQLLRVPAPKPATADAQNDDYRFERPVTFIHTAAQSTILRSRSRLAAITTALVVAGSRSDNRNTRKIDRA